MVGRWLLQSDRLLLGKPTPTSGNARVGIISVHCSFFFLLTPILCIFFFCHLRQSLYMHVSNSENIFNSMLFLFRLDIHSHILRTCWHGDAKFVFLLQDKAQNRWKWVFLVSSFFLSFKFQPPPPNTAPYSCFPLYRISSFLNCCHACNPFTLWQYNHTPCCCWVCFPLWWPLIR